MNKNFRVIMFTTFFWLTSLPVRANDSSILGKVCKATVASVFGRDHKTMKLEKIVDDVAFIHYVRPGDDTRWSVKCKLDGGRVIWASNNSDDSKRWRTDPLDDVIKYSIEDAMLTITQEYTDGSSSNDEYKLSGL